MSKTNEYWWFIALADPSSTNYDKDIDYFYDTTSYKVNKYLPGSKIKVKKYKKFKNFKYK